MLVNVAMTYGRITAVAHGRRSLVDTLAAVWHFLRKNFASAIFLYMGLVVGLVLIMGVSWMLATGAHVLPTTIGIVTVFILEQVLSLTCSWYRLVGYASQLRLYLTGPN
jgi:hypothetical protein